MSLLTSQMTSKMSTAYSGLSALIQAATSQLGDLAETNTPGGSPTMHSNPTTPMLEGADLDLDGTSSWHRRDSAAATVTPLLTSIPDRGSGVAAKFFFPEVLMILLVNPAYEDIVTFLPDGKYFAIRRVDFSNLLLYKHFHLKSFEDFLELTRGWGFVRVNGNINEDGDNNNTNNGNCNVPSINNDSSSSSSNSKTDICVFRHPQFKKNQPVDMNKIRFDNGDGKNRKHSRSSTGDEAPPRIILEKTVSDDSNTSNRSMNNSNNNNNNNTKRKLSPSRVNRDSEDYRQRLRTKSKPFPVDVDPLSLSVSTYDQSGQQVRRRSSLELRCVAQAITESKLHLNSGELIKEDDNNDHDSPMLNIMNSSTYPRSGPGPTSPPQLERGQSTSSSLVDGGVETATHNIVTDAIEALLFDESHTRETYNRHEKELSVSSLPGVVPISKQLFSPSENNNSNSNGASSNDGASKTTSGGKKDRTSSSSKKRKSKGRGRKTTAKPQSSSSSSSWAIHTTIGSLEDASRNNGSGLSSSFSNNSNLRVIIPSGDGGGAQQRQGSYGSMVVSPARMEAAAALVSQSRYRNDEEL